MTADLSDASDEVEIRTDDAKDAYRAVIWVRNGMALGSPGWIIWDQLARRIADQIEKTRLNKT